MRPRPCFRVARPVTRHRAPSGVAVAALSLGVALGGVAALALAFHYRYAIYAALDYAAWIGAVWFAVLS